MKLTTLFSLIFKRLRSPRIHSLDSKQVDLMRQGREQFKKLVDKGLSVPVVFL